MLRLAKRGEVPAFKALEPWIVGKVPDVVQQEGNVTVRVVFEDA